MIRLWQTWLHWKRPSNVLYLLCSNPYANALLAPRSVLLSLETDEVARISQFTTPSSARPSRIQGPADDADVIETNHVESTLLIAEDVRPSQCIDIQSGISNAENSACTESTLEAVSFRCHLHLSWREHNLRRERPSSTLAPTATGSAPPSIRFDLGAPPSVLSALSV